METYADLLLKAIVLLKKANQTDLVNILDRICGYMVELERQNKKLKSDIQGYKDQIEDIFTRI